MAQYRKPELNNRILLQEAFPVLNTEGDADGGEDGNDDDDELNIKDEEIEPLKVPSSPSQPTAAEIEEHRITHLPFRRWCRECMMGRGLGEQRGRHQGREHEIAIVGVDYFYVTSRGVEDRKELDEEFPETSEGEAKMQAARQAGGIVKCLVIRCHKTKNIFAHVVPFKGPDEDKFVFN